MAKWSRQTYEMVANGIKSELERRESDGDTALLDLAYYFAGQFTADNRTFNRKLFMEACGLGKDGNGQEKD